MKIGVVSGNVVSTINHPFFDGRRLMICDLITPDGEPNGYTIAVDTVDAGVGDTVLVIDEGEIAWARGFGLADADDGVFLAQRRPGVGVDLLTHGHAVSSSLFIVVAVEPRLRPEGDQARQHVTSGLHNSFKYEVFSFQNQPA